MKAMAERKKSDPVGGEGTSAPQASPEGKTELKSELPRVESPPLSPGVEAPAVKSDEPASTKPALGLLGPRHTRLPLLAASVVVAASLGAVIGAAAAGGWWSKPSTDNKAIQAAHEQQAMRQAIDRLSRQVAALKGDLDQASKSTHIRIAKLTDRLESIRAAVPARSPETTGSIPAQKAASVPLPRPAPRVAAAESRPVIVPGWSIRNARGGFIYVESRGDIYQVVPGAYLPGLGPVQSIERKDGHWAVVTPHGLIVSMSDRRFFD